ncbi:ferritin family protein [Geobacter sulfurreducens]|uniref:ferritin family protein n=1 Tax=Geobacter sulfurreducens TaxID=35554 RepID=UPI000DBB331F|nr:ferritin family protein [Geobacter sulfurreducens]BBA70057.1 hypothetical protein YM18_1522 [Geobacter sulfurreducens]
MKLTADVVLQIAMELERRGRIFYESLAIGCGNGRISALAAALAKAELDHLETFTRMRERLPESMRGPNLTDEELMTAADHVRTKVLPRPSVVSETVIASNLSKALDMAIVMEADSVAFYAEAAAGFDGIDADVIAAIVAEEREHLVMLQEVRNLCAAVFPE